MTRNKNISNYLVLWEKEPIDNGGPGSGNFGHCGRPGQEGGSGDCEGLNYEGKHTVDGINYDSRDGLGAVPDNQNIEYKGFVTYMKAKDFISLNPARTEMRSVDHIKEVIKRGEPIGPPIMTVELQEGSSGTSWVVIGHEGRGRAIAISQLHPEARIPVQLFPRHPERELRARHLTPDMMLNYVHSDERVPEHLRVAVKLKESYWQGERVTKQINNGGAGSGNFDHCGRPGEVGGSGDCSGNIERILNKLKSEIVKAAQEEYDSWDASDPEYGDCEVGHGGICSLISSKISDIVASNTNLNVTEGGQEGDDHSWVIAYNEKEAWGIDISPSVYETGAGYSWKKISDVTISENDVDIWKLDIDPKDLVDNSLGFNLFSKNPLASIPGLTLESSNSKSRKVMHRLKSRLVANAANFRYESLDGKRYLVVPMVMLTHGVHRGSLGPIYYPEPELAKTPLVWNTTPIVVYHPTKNGKPTTAKDPEILRTRRIGMVMNTVYEKGKLKAEAWLDEKLCDIVDKRVLASIRNNQKIELSTGLHADRENQKGLFNGKPFEIVARNYRPDHLAILPDIKGACSINDNCGVLANNRELYSSLKNLVLNNKNCKGKCKCSKEEKEDGECSCAKKDKDYKVMNEAIHPLSRLNTLLVQGGSGSGNFGHCGRPGEVGGSGDCSGSSGPSKDSGRGKSKKKPKYSGRFRVQRRDPWMPDTAKQAKEYLEKTPMKQLLADHGKAHVQRLKKFAAKAAYEDMVQEAKEVMKRLPKDDSIDFKLTKDDLDKGSKYDKMVKEAKDIMKKLPKDDSVDFDLGEEIKAGRASIIKKPRSKFVNITKQIVDAQSRSVVPPGRYKVVDPIGGRATRRQHKRALIIPKGGKLGDYKTKHYHVPQSSIDKLLKSSKPRKKR